MATTEKTPGVYIKEIALFPPSVAEVATAIPAFIGYTEKAVNDKDVSLNLVPTKIKSLLEFENWFGKGFNPADHPAEYDVFVNPVTRVVDSVSTAMRFYLYDSLKLFFDNGGGDCYIVSVKTYKEVWEYSDAEKKYKGDKLSAKDIQKGIDALALFDEPTLILFPDAVGLESDDDGRFTDLADLQQGALRQCAKLQDRFTIMDVMDGFLPTTAPSPIDKFRQYIGVNNLSYGAAYYPWLKTNTIPEIKWEQIKFIQTTDKKTALDTDTFFDTDALYTDYKKKATDADAITAKLTALADDKASVQEKLDSIKTAVSEEDDPDNLKILLTDYLNLLAGAALYFPVLEESCGSDLKKILAVYKSDSGLQNCLRMLISFEKNPGVIALDSRTNSDGVNKYYAGLFKAPTEWVGKIAFDKIEDNSATFTPADQMEVIEGLITAKIPEKLINTILKISQDADKLVTLAKKSLLDNQPVYKTAFEKIKDYLRLIPPSGAIAGIYASVDRLRGVWKAPANVSITGILGPAVKIDNHDQEDMNVHYTGKSVNAIRTFTGKGTLVWGARTLAGNDNEWRYIPVRRFFNMVEESVKKATEPFVFEPNDKNTWVKTRAMIANFLTLQWRAGALQGAKPEDAFFVHVGLGETMTELDILEGRMIVEIGMAVVRPAEFIILRFSHKMMEK
jgi:phage tail sheath protein FI